MDLLDRFLGHDVWTTAQLLKVCDALADDQLDADFGFGQRTLRNAFDHLIANLEVWTDLMRGRPARSFPDAPPTLAELRARLKAAAADFTDLARETQRAGRLDDTFVDSLADPPRRKTLGAGIVHVVTHSMHHRAQVLAYLELLGVAHRIEGDALMWERIVVRGGTWEPAETPLKLTVELVPQTSWYSNMRSAVSKERWDACRKQVYADGGNRCGICGATGRLECHEIWEHDDAAHVQTLRGFIALCPLCHHVKHIGLAGIMASEGRLDYAKVVAHFMQVNRCDRAAFDAHVDAAFAQWEARSKHAWRIDLGEWESWVEPDKREKAKRRR